MDLDIHNDSTDSTECVDVEQTAWVADILRNRRRIQVLIELDSVGEDGMSLGALADRLAERDHSPDFTPGERKRIYIVLHQCHIPRLSIDNVVNRRRDLITPGSRYSDVLSALLRLQR
jgi:hypothetical protein